MKHWTSIRYSFYPFFVLLLVYANLSPGQVHRVRRIERMIEKEKYPKALRKAEGFCHDYPCSPQGYLLLTNIHLQWSGKSTGKQADSHLTQAIRQYTLAKKWVRKAKIKPDSSFNHVEASLRKRIHGRALLLHQRAEKALARKYTLILAQDFYDTTQLYYQFRPAELRKKRLLSEKLYLTVDRQKLDSLKSYDYRAVDAMVKKIPLAITRDMAMLCRYLARFTKNEPEKVRAVYSWITHNIKYDYSYTIYDGAPTFKARKGVCNGFSELFVAMCQAMGIEAYLITGYAKGASYRKGVPFNKANHAWNGVRIQERYYLLDCTWAACTGWQNTYYLSRPEELINSHLPLDNKWQLLPKPVSKAVFEATAEGRRYLDDNKRW